MSLELWCGCKKTNSNSSLQLFEKYPLYHTQFVTKYSKKLEYPPPPNAPTYDITTPFRRDQKFSTPVDRCLDPMSL